MAGLFETAGKLFNTLGQSTDLANDTLAAGRVYTKNFKTQAKKNITKEVIKSDVKHEVAMLKLNGIKARIEQAIKDNDWDLVDDLTEEL